MTTILPTRGLVVAGEDDGAGDTEGAGVLVGEAVDEGACETVGAAVADPEGVGDADEPHPATRATTVTRTAIER